MSKKHLVAVYGSLKRGYGNFRVMERAKGKFILEAISKKTFVMDGSGYPYINYATGENAHPIFVELFEVDEWGFTNPLDSLEGHPHFYKRELETFVLPDGTEVEAWVYVLQSAVEANLGLLKEINGQTVYFW